MKKICSYLGVLLLGLFLVPAITFALDADKIKESKELVINAVTPKDDDSFFITNDWWSMKNDGYYLGNCASDYTKCNIYYQGSEVATDIAIKYEYDPIVKIVVDSIIKKVPSTGKEFILSDIEMVFYAKYTQYFWSHLDPNANLKEEDYPNPIRFSSEYKEFIGYKNFVFEPRMGYESSYSDFMGGTATFEYNGTLYGTTDGIGTKVNYTLYVPDDTTDIIKTLEERLKPYFPDVTITYDSNGTVQDNIDSEVNYYKTQYAACKTFKENIMAIPESERNFDNQEYKENYTNYSNSCYSFGSWESQEFGDSDQYAAELEADLKANEYAAVVNAEPGFYMLEFENGQGLYFPVVKDSSKIITKELNITTIDSASNVEIKTKANIPLDTLIEVAKITSGEEYDAIVKVLNKTDVEMFDLKLFSKSANNYISKLDDGNFEVKLPIKDEFLGKDLVVYYVDENNKVVEYTVTITEDGYAVFTTDHFSIYTLALADPKEQTTSTTEEKVINNPATGDNITLYYGLLVMSILSLEAATIIKKRFN